MPVTIQICGCRDFPILSRLRRNILRVRVMCESSHFLASGTPRITEFKNSVALDCEHTISSVLCKGLEFLQRVGLIH